MNEKVNALILIYQANLQAAKANLLTYLNNSVGVGEHPDTVGECARLVDKMAHAKGCLDLLQEMFPPQDPQQVEGE